MARGTLRTDIDEAKCAARLEELYAHEMKLFNAKPKPKEPVGLYSLRGGQNGGSDPNAKGPWSIIEGGGKRSDCIGTYTWARGVDRFQPVRFAHLYGGYCNTDSILLDAVGEKAVTGKGSTKAPQKLWRPAKAPRVGLAVVYPGKYTDGKKNKGSYGHIMGIVAIEPFTGQWPGLAAAARNLTVVHCHGGKNGREKRAIDRQKLTDAISAASIARAYIIELVPGVK